MFRGNAPFDRSRGNAPSYNNMATSSGDGESVVQSDPSGLPYLYNTVTQRIQHLAFNGQGEQSNPLLPETGSVGFNVLGGSQRYPNAVSDVGQSWTRITAGPWKEYTDTATGSRYWYNEITGERTRDSAIIDHNPPPLSPWTPSPPSPPSPPTSPPPRRPSAPCVEHTRDQWCRYFNMAGTAVWYNRVTGKAQENKPRCG